eukprot:TRINITY_DN3849_c1_g1_i4.p3 TRINITY_DN3849_c1_g1~~TRINITY_DN3849_c1_g1_i4.p3  ORF type:complete len:137 (-),score=15.34 TRINITY_DN3849_c1_g1_i4:380-790(-)
MPASLAGPVEDRIEALRYLQQRFPNDEAVEYFLIHYYALVEWPEEAAAVCQASRFNQGLCQEVASAFSPQRIQQLIAAANITKQDAFHTWVPLSQREYTAPASVSTGHLKDWWLGKCLGPRSMSTCSGRGPTEPAR